MDDAGPAGSGRSDCSVFSYDFTYGCFRSASHRLTGISLLSHTGLYRTYRAAFSADSAGCHEPAVFLAQCVHGNHDHLRFLRQARGKFKQSRQPD